MHNTKTAPLLARSETPWPKLQQRFLAVLSCEEHRTKTVKEICQLAGFASTQAWYRALQDERFADLVSTLGIIKKKRATSKLSKVQQRLLDVLQQEENRHKPITEICRLAGCTYSAWYWAVANDQFVRAMEALRVTYRRNIRIPHLEVTPATNVEEELAKDV